MDQSPEFVPLTAEEGGLLEPRTRQPVLCLSVSPSYRKSYPPEKSLVCEAVSVRAGQYAPEKGAPSTHSVGR